MLCVQSMSGCKIKTLSWEKPPLGYFLQSNRKVLKVYEMFVVADCDLIKLSSLFSQSAGGDREAGPGLHDHSLWPGDGGLSG